MLGRYVIYAVSAGVFENRTENDHTAHNTKYVGRMVVLAGAASIFFLKQPRGIDVHLCVILRLSVPERVILAVFIGKERFMTAALDDLAVMKNQDLIAEAA